MWWSTPELREALASIAETQHLHTRLLRKIMKGEDDLNAAIAENAQALLDAAAQLAADADKLIQATQEDGDIENAANQLKANTAQFKLALANSQNPQPKPVEGTGGAANPAPAPDKPVDDPAVQA